MTYCIVLLLIIAYYAAVISAGLYCTASLYLPDASNETIKAYGQRDYKL